MEFLRRAGSPLTIVLPALVALGCAQSRPVRPLGVGEGLVGVSVGGPMLRLFGAAFPTPILEASGAYGLRERLAVAGNVDLTAALYGTLHVEPGVVWHPVVREAGLWPSLAVAGSVHVLTDFEALRVAPQAAGLLVWPLGRVHAVYAGAEAAVVSGAPTRVVAGPLAGAELRSGRMGFGLELAWLAPQYDVEPVAPSWLSPGHHGFLSVVLGFRYHARVRP